MKQITGTIVINDCDIVHPLSGMPANEKLIARSLTAPQGLVAMDESGNVVDADRVKHESQFGLVTNVWVDLDCDETYARRVLGLAPNCIVIGLDDAPDINSMGLTSEVINELDAAGVRDDAVEEILQTHWNAMAELLSEEGYVVTQCERWEIETEIARGAIDRDDIVDTSDDAEGARSDLIAASQSAWDSIHSEDIARRVLDELI